MNSKSSPPQVHYLSYKLACREKKGMEFQHFFEAIMSHYDPRFISIKPRGNKGDWKCDGYSPGTKTVFQCYAPEELKEKDARQKIDEDFEGALAQWGSKMKCWVFLYAQADALYPDLAAHVSEMGEAHPDITIETWNSERLWRDVVSTLPENTRDTLLGFAPRPVEPSLVSTNEERVIEKLAAIDLQLRKLAVLPVSVPVSASQIPEQLQTRFQKRFDKYRTQLIDGSIQHALDGYTDLIADLTAVGTIADTDLLFRSYLNYSSCLIELKRLPEASSELDKARDLLPDDLRLKRHTAILLSHEGKTEQALEVVRELRSAEPNDHEHLRNEAALLLSLQRFDELTSLFECHPIEDAGYFAIIAQFAVAQGRFQDAQKAAQRACDLEPDNEAPWIALAYAFGFPVVGRLQKNIASALSARDDEIAQLLKAIDASRRAGEILKKQNRLEPLAEVLTNTMAFYAALNKNEEAIAIGDELLGMGHHSEVMLRNLFCVQMRSGSPSRALSAAEAMMMGGLEKEGRLRKMQALVALGHFESVLPECEQIRSTFGVDYPDDWVVVESRALCAAHQHEKAIALLDESLSSRPNATDLHLERAAVMEELGRNGEAADILAKAEKTAPESTQAIIDFGAFLVRQCRWHEALPRLEKIGASSPCSPLHQSYLICLFNSNARTRCFALVKSWIDTGMGYDDTVYSLGARCAMLCEDMQQAREFLEELLRNGCSRNGEHRRMLGQTYLRLDELEEAFTLLTKVVTDDPKDVEALILLTHVCTARGRHLEALAHIENAVQIEPDNLRARALFFSTMVAIPSGITPSDASITEHHKNIEILSGDSNQILRPIDLKPDTKDLLKILRKNEQKTRRVFKAARSHSLPWGFIATQTGTPLTRAWFGSICQPNRSIHLCTGDFQSQQEQVACAAKSDAVSVDILALFTLQGLGLLSVVSRRFANIYAHISLLDTVVTELKNLLENSKGGRIGTHRGRFFIVDNDPVQNERTIAFLTGIRDFLKNPPVKLVGLGPDVTVDPTTSSILTSCGRPCIAPIFVGKEHNASLLSDDLVVRNIANVILKVPGFNTQSLLRILRNDGSVSNREYQDAVLQLIEWNYQFVSTEAGTLIRLFERTNGSINQLGEKLISRMASPPCTIDNSLRIFARFLCYLWEIPSTNSFQTYCESWACAIWEAILPTCRLKGALRFLLCLFAFYFRVRPGTFLSIIIWALQHVSPIGPLRELILLEMRRIILTYARLGSESFQSFPNECWREWEEQGRNLELLIRSGVV